MPPVSGGVFDDNNEWRMANSDEFTIRDVRWIALPIVLR
jgi:hypothetical protein